MKVEAVNKPRLIVEAYSAFHNYSIGSADLNISRTCSYVLGNHYA